MKELEQLIYLRVTNDTDPIYGLMVLLGDQSHFIHAFQNDIPEVPYLTYQIFNQVRGQLGGNFNRSLELFVQFNIFAADYMDIANRLRQLFDGYRFDVPGDYTTIGQARGVFDLEQSDAYDEQLEVQLKQVRYRFFVTPKAWNPITA